VNAVADREARALCITKAQCALGILLGLLRCSAFEATGARTMAMKMRETRQAGRFRVAGFRQWWLAFGAAVLAVGCGGGTPPEPVTPTVESANALPVGDTGQAADAPADTVTKATTAGEQALREQRLFLPVSDNAFEHFLSALAADPANERARLALLDLVPYAVLHIEQRLAAEDADEAARLLALLQRAAADAPALPRLQDGLVTLQARQATQQLAAETAAEAATGATRNAAEPLAASAGTIAAPAQSAPSVPPERAAETAADAAGTSEPLSAAAAEPANPPAAAPVDVTPPPAAPVPARVPEVVYRPALRYPPMAERRRIEGFVEIEFTIDADGSVAELEILRSEPEGMFDREALAAMQRWRFAPPAAPLRARRTLEFKLAR
jgi:protein TonB